MVRETKPPSSSGSNQHRNQKGRVISKRPDYRGASVDVAKADVRRVGLKTAPCTNCSIPVVYGQRSCLQCGQRFNYGANPPTEPPSEIIQKCFSMGKKRLEAAGKRREQPTSELDSEQQKLLAERLARRQTEAAQAEAVAQLDIQAQLNAQISNGAAPSVNDQIAQQAINAQVSAAPAQSNAGADSGLASFVDTGRYEVIRRPVQTEDIPGFIDSTLFAAYTPKDDTSSPMAELQGTAHLGGDVQVANIDMAQMGLELTSQAAVGQVQIEDIPGFIDSTLFAAYTPDHVDTEDVIGLQATPNTGRVFASETAADEDVSACASCGTGFAIDRSRCPSCGAPRSTNL